MLEQMERLKDFDTWKEWKNTGIETMLIEKINELVDQVDYLKKEVERLEKVKAKRTVIMGGR
jgi:hypothetical protein